MRTLRSGQLFLAALFVLVLGFTETAQAFLVDPTSSFTTRRIGTTDTLVGDAVGQEGNQFNSTFLAIKQGTEDRTVAEYDMSGAAMSSLVELLFTTNNLDDPAFSQLSLYAFNANGLVNQADFDRTDVFVTNFTDNGVDPSSFALDVTAVYNNAVTNAWTHLGFLFLADDSNARYDLATFPTGPQLSVADIPEPAGLALLFAGGAGLALGIRRRRQRDAG